MVIFTTHSFIPEKEPMYSLDRRLSGPQRRSGSFEEEIHFLPLPGIE
jgi:hypothetical protein